MTDDNRLTAADKEQFEDFLLQWRDLLNLREWRYVQRSKPSRAMAEITQQNTEHRLVRWAIGDSFGVTPVTPDSLESVAIHENLHVMLHKLIETAAIEGEYSQAVRAEEHAVITVLEPLLLRLSHYVRVCDDLSSLMKAKKNARSPNTSK